MDAGRCWVWRKGMRNRGSSVEGRESECVRRKVLESRGGMIVGML